MSPGRVGEVTAALGGRPIGPTTWPWALGWAASSLASTTAFELWVPRQNEGLGTRLAVHAEAFALAIALSLVCAAVTDAGRRWVTRPLVRVALVGAIVAFLGATIIEEDARGIAESLPGPGLLWSAALGALVAAGAAAGFLAGRLAAPRTGTRAAAIALALAVAILHHRALGSGYEGVHLAASFGSAALIAGAIEATGLLRAAPDGRAGRVLTGALAVVGAGGLVVDPGSDVVLLAKHLPGHALPSFAARARRTLRPKTFATADDSPWLRARTVPVPPTAPRPRREVENVVVLVVDTMRADVIDGPAADRFPNFHRLAASSLAFTHARSVAPHTTPAIASLMTGKYFSQLVWSYRDRSRPRPYTDTSATIGEELSKGGWSSVGYVCLKQLSDPDQKLTRGLSEGAARVEPVAKIVDKVRRRLKKQPAAKADKGLFIYAHVGEPHHPYEGKGQTDWDRYLSEIATVDSAIGPLLDDVLTGPLSGTTALIVTADHGEAFGEHGTTEHGATVYDELMRIPFYVHIPGARTGRTDAPISLLDLGPTILDLAGIATPASFMGQSILPIVAGRVDALERPLLMESGRSMRAYVEDGRWKLIHDVRRGTYELYDLDTDPKEANNTFEADRARAERMAGFTQRFFEVHAHRAPEYEVPYIP